MADKALLQIIDPSSSRQRKRFLAFFYDIMKNHEDWVPPLRMLQMQVIDPAKNPFLQETAHQFYMVRKNGNTIGRFAIFGPGQWIHWPETGSFGFLDFIEEHAEEVLELLKEAALAKGIRKLVGPFNPNIHYDIGVMSQGFDQANYILMNYNPPYYASSYERAGFEVLQRFNTWSLWKENYQLNPRLEKILRLKSSSEQLNIRMADLKNFRVELQLFHELYNCSFRSHWGFHPASWDEFRFIGSDLKHLIKPEMALIAELAGKPVGFVLSLPNLNELLQDNRSGKLGMTTIYKLLFRRGQIRTVRVMIMGVLPEYRNRGVHLQLFRKIAENIFALGYQGGEVAWVMEGNSSVENTLKLMGAKREKQYQLYHIRL